MPSVEEALEKELAQAKTGTHQRQKGEEKRLQVLKAKEIKDAEQQRKVQVALVDGRFEEAKREAEEEFNREKSIIQDRLAHELVERQKRTSTSKIEDIRAMTRRYQGRTRGVDAAGTKREPGVKGAAVAVPLRQGEVEEDFEAMAQLSEIINPSLDVGFMEIEVRAKDRQRPVDVVVPKLKPDGTSGKRQRRVDFDFRGKPRAEVSGARITVWYEEEHGGRKMDVPYLGVVKSCDPREGLYVMFDDTPDEMLITNEDDWRWGTHTRKPTEPKRR
mmetsp:Transcript_13404/g.26994  ORF Transcript_13404/g.26994 Transcript_13404/m.26994 type:complete len:274 (-) Transcript_13404:342-1163(-)